MESIFRLFLFSRGGLACTVHLAGTPPSVQEIIPSACILFPKNVTDILIWPYGPSSYEQIGMVVDGSVLIWTRVRDLLYDV